MSSMTTRGEQLTMIKLVSDLRHVYDFLLVHWYHPPIKLATTIYPKYSVKWC